MPDRFVRQAEQQTQHQAVTQSGRADHRGQSINPEQEQQGRRRKPGQRHLHRRESDKQGRHHRDECRDKLFDQGKDPEQDRRREQCAKDGRLHTQLRSQCQDVNRRRQRKDTSPAENYAARHTHLLRMPSAHQRDNRHDQRQSGQQCEHRPMCGHNLGEAGIHEERRPFLSRNHRRQSNKIPSSAAHDLMASPHPA